MVIREMSKKYYPIQLLCKIADVSRSGYYKWLKSKISPNEKQLLENPLPVRTRYALPTIKLKGGPINTTPNGISNFFIKTETIHYFIRIFHYVRCWLFAVAPVFRGVIIYRLGDEGS